jgi:hypothetical protein
MPGLPPGVSTLPANVSVSGHVLGAPSSSTRLDAYANKPHHQLRLTSGTYASRPAKPSTLNHSKRNSALVNSTISERDRDTLARDYSFKSDPVSIAARQRLSNGILKQPPSNKSPDAQSIGSGSSQAASQAPSSSYPASTFSSAATSQYNPFSYIPSAAVARHRSAALKAAQNSYSLSNSSALRDHSTKSSRVSTLAIDEDAASSAGSSVQWNDPIDLATLKNESVDNLKLGYVPSLEHPERHRSKDHAPKIGGMVVPEGVDKGYSAVRRNWEKAKLDVGFAMLRAKRGVRLLLNIEVATHFHADEAVVFKVACRL